MKPIYVPKGKAKEYGDYAINIYTGCPHRCYYCFAPSVLRKDKEQFWNNVEQRDGIIEATKRQLEREQITGKTIHLCFTCDPYPTGKDSTATREIIKLLKEHGNHVQILTKGDGRRDFDLLDSDDWYGVTIDGSCEVDYYRQQYLTLEHLKWLGVNTWVSFEPVICAENVYDVIAKFHGVIDKAKIGKLNYHPSNIDWRKFGETVERMCQTYGVDYYIKDSLRKEMREVTK
jgi:DNA repair photolyase